MPPVIIVFEDHTAAGFRPLSWSVPVWELRCGILNLRERLDLLSGRDSVLLPRSYLSGLARSCGHAAGVDATREALAGRQRALWVAARVGANWDVLATLVETAEAGRDRIWRDGDGLLAVTMPATAAADLLDDWATWDDQVAAAGCWRIPGVDPPRWQPELAGAELETVVSGELPPAWSRLWDLIPATGPAIVADVERLSGRGLPARRPWGVVLPPGRHALWEHASPLAAGGARLDGVHVVRPDRVWLGPDVTVAPGVAIDAAAGPIILDRSVLVMPHSYLAGPLYVGAGTVVKAGAQVYGETSLGAGCKVAGEIGESTFLDLVNKQHDGFIGHAYLASWVNLGAMTTCSDLKNNYGPVRIDCGSGSEQTGLRFLGLMMGEHGKTAIGTLFNTGTAVGFASNVFGAGFPPKFLPNFTWGDGRTDERQDPERAAATAETAMARRDCCFTDAHRELIKYLAG